MEHDGPVSPEPPRPPTGRADAALVHDRVTLRLPRWVGAHLASNPGVQGTIEEQMRFVLDLAAAHVEHRSGGPFAAAVFASDGTLVSVGLNTVVPSTFSSAHAEVVALLLAHRHQGTHDLSAAQPAPFALVASGEMCAMCLGATVWSGVSSVAWSATTEDIETITGFDEGPRHPDAHGELRRRGIVVQPGVLRRRGRAVLRAYADAGGEVYNPSSRVQGAETQR